MRNPSASVLKLNAPNMVSGWFMMSKMVCIKPWGSNVSAWRKRSTLPLAAAAPRFCCKALPDLLLMTRAPEDSAILTVESVLPPSTTSTSESLSKAL